LPKKMPSAVAVVTGVYLILLLATLSGISGLLVKEGSLNRWPAALSIVIYWLLTCSGVKLVTSWRSRWRMILFSGAALIMAMLTAEVVIRCFHPAHAMLQMMWLYSPRLHHIQPANTEMYQGIDMETSKVTTIRTNEDGFRSGYSREDFRRHKERIVVQGDSYAFGLFVSQEGALPQALEEELRARAGKDIAVLNAGVVSHSPFLHVLMYEHILKAYHPTMVLVLLDVTDIGDDHEYSTHAEMIGGQYAFKRCDSSAWFDREPGFGRRSALYQRLYWGFLFLKGLVFRPLEVALSDPSPMKVHGIEIDGVTETNKYFIYRHPLEKTRQYFARTFANLVSLAKMASADGADFVLVIAPRYHHWNPSESPYNWETVLGLYSLNEPYQFEYFRFFEENQTRVDFPIFNLLAAFKTTRESPLVFASDPHWNNRGHRVAAEAIAGYLLDHGLVQSSHIGGEGDNGESR